jgi:hypothetical protein
MTNRCKHRAFTRRSFLAVASAIMLSACGSDDPTGIDNDDDDDPPAGPPAIAGSYTATTFQATPSGQATINMLAQGATLAIVIAENKSTTGTLFIPAAITGEGDLTASMNGTAVQSGTSVTFQQSADTFIRDLTWSVNGKLLQVVSQTRGGTSFTITLTRP